MTFSGKMIQLAGRLFLRSEKSFWFCTYTCLQNVDVLEQRGLLDCPEPVEVCTSLEAPTERAELHETQPSVEQSQATCDLPVHAAKEKVVDLEMTSKRDEKSASLEACDEAGDRGGSPSKEVGDAELQRADEMMQASEGGEDVSKVESVPQPKVSTECKECNQLLLLRASLDADLPNFLRELR